MWSAALLAAGMSLMPAVNDPSVAPDDVWPGFVVKGVVGLPSQVGVHVEVNIIDGAGVEVGINAPLIIPGSYTAGGYWRPLAWEGESYDLRLGLGGQIFAFYDQSFIPYSIPEGLLVLSGQAAAAWRPLPELPFGLFAGARLGAGPAFAAENLARIEPGILIQLELGLVLY